MKQTCILYTVKRSPGRPHHRRRRQHLKDVGSCERPPRRLPDRRGDAAESPESHIVLVGSLSWSRCVECCHASECRPAPASITTRWWLLLRGWSPDHSLRNNHGTCLSNENSDNADNPSKVVMLPVTSHAWCQSVCFTLTHSGHQRRSSVT